LPDHSSAGTEKESAGIAGTAAAKKSYRTEPATESDPKSSVRKNTKVGNN